MLDKEMYLPPKETKKMPPEKVARLALHWAHTTVDIFLGNVCEMAYLAKQIIPRSYVQIRREPESGDEWLHYGTRWLNADLTDTKVKLAPRKERAEEEIRALHDAERQIEELKKFCDDQRKRINALGIQE